MSNPVMELHSKHMIQFYTMEMSALFAQLKIQLYMVCHP
jgi:hypothetical protein